MADTKPAAVVDLEALKRQLQTKPSLNEYRCARCRAEFSIDDGLDPSVFCHSCAHEVAESVLPALIAELERLRAGVPERRAKESALRELKTLVETKKWIAVAGGESSKEASWGRAFQFAMAALLAKYASPPEAVKP